MKTKFKVGDEVIINNKPSSWSSSAGGECPLGAFFPFTGTIESIKEGYLQNHIGVKIGQYGFTLVNKNKEGLEQTGNIVYSTDGVLYFEDRLFFEPLTQKAKDFCANMRYAFEGDRVPFPLYHYRDFAPALVRELISFRMVGNIPPEISERSSIKQEFKPTPKQFFRHFTHHGLLPRGTVYGELQGDVLRLSVAVCSGQDNFSRKKGRELAQKRMEISPCMTVKAPQKGGRFFFKMAEEAIIIFGCSPQLLMPIEKRI